MYQTRGFSGLPSLFKKVYLERIKHKLTAYGVYDPLINSITFFRKIDYFSLLTKEAITGEYIVTHNSSKQLIHCIHISCIDGYRHNQKDNV